ncbi:MAG: hypothetical protein KGD70_05470 [Candidatus Lokiarchaeota archaeon]|nr:hypothetical protein [Candidatus Lokiarchaeota archaeon]
MSISKKQFKNYFYSYLITTVLYLISSLIFLPYFAYGGFLSVSLYFGSVFTFKKYLFNASFKIGLIGNLIFFIPIILIILFFGPYTQFSFLMFFVFLPISLITWINTIIILIMSNRLLKNSPNLREEHEIEKKVEYLDFETRKNRLIGMIRIDKFLDLEKAHLFLGMSKFDIKALIYDLAGEKKIDGTFEENKFHIISNLDDFLMELELSFISWQEKSTQNVSKVN